MNNTRQNTNVRNMLSFNDALYFIQNYDGRVETVHAFCKSLLNLIITYEPNSESHILQILPRKLKGRANQVFAGSVSNFNSVKKFIKALKLQHYARCINSKNETEKLISI